jgi:hypothetical protein
MREAFVVGAIQQRLVAAGPLTPRRRLSGTANSGTPPKNSKALTERADPVIEALRPSRLVVAVVGHAEDGDEAVSIISSVGPQ